MKRVFLALFLLLSATGFFLFDIPSSNAAYGTQASPKLMNLWFGWQISDADIQALSKWDVVVFDVDQQARFPDKIRALRKLNPNIKILAYVDSSGVAAARFVEESNFPGYILAHATPEEWFLHRGTTRVGFWPGAWTLNVTDQAPVVNGHRWNDYLPEFIQQNVWSSGLWDGIFLDNALAGPTWFVGNGLDMNGDGKADPDAEVNAAWIKGWKKMADDLHNRLGSKAIIMGNGDATYAANLNGVLFEDFPSYGWAAGYEQYRASVSQNHSPSFTAINANANNVNNPNDYKDMRLGLGTAMLSDGYYSFDYGNQNHGQSWWYDEYDVKLGNAKAAPKRMDTSTAKTVDGVWWRDYEKGAVLVNGTKASQNISLPGVFERLRGSQDSTTNNGRMETSIALASRDAILLYRRSDATTIAQSTIQSPSPSTSQTTSKSSQSTSYVNGSFVRVYAEDGSQPRAGFFVQQSAAPGGAVVLVADLDRDGKVDTAYADKGAITILYGNGNKKNLRPFGTTFKGTMTIASGNTDRDSSFEFAVGRSGSDEVRLLKLDGSIRARWDAYTPAFKGGVNVGVGDLNGDGLREVVTGAGPSGGPHIRVFKTDGTFWGLQFFAFDSHERGGVSVAVGDVNGDGKDEIVAGSGRGTIPRVRIFSGSGTLLREFALGSKPAADGVSVSLTDMNGDGKLEILATASPVN